MKSTLQAKLAAGPEHRLRRDAGCPAVALAAITRSKAASSKAKIVTFDLNADAAKAIKDGTIVFSVDQQPYLQGYEAVDSLWLYLTNGNVLGGGQPVLTGPAFVDSQNIAQIAKFAATGTR